MFAAMNCTKHIESAVRSFVRGDLHWRDLPDELGVQFSFANGRLCGDGSSAPDVVWARVAAHDVAHGFLKLFGKDNEYLRQWAAILSGYSEIEIAADDTLLDRLSEVLWRVAFAEELSDADIDFMRNLAGAQ